MGTPSVIKVSNLVKQFKQQLALNNLNFEVEQGEIFGFLGPSGSGKTTTIKILTGQLVATSGKTTLLGIETNKLTNDIFKEIGIVTDQSGLYEDVSVFHNLLLFAQLLGVSTERVNYLLERVGLSNERKKTAKKLSKGMRQRLVLARALLHSPKVLFLDEPTSGLDPATAQAIHRLLLDERQKGTTIFLTTHNMEEATKLCDKVALLNEGKIITLNSPQNICLQFERNHQFKIRLFDGSQYELKQDTEGIHQLIEWFQLNLIDTIHSNEPTLEEVFIAKTGRELL